MVLVHFELQKVKKLFVLKFPFFLSKSFRPDTYNGKNNSVNNTSPVSSQYGLKHSVWQKNRDYYVIKK